MSARLVCEREAIEGMLARPCRARLGYASDDGRTYQVLFDVRTVVRGADGVIREAARIVPVVYELAATHPVVAPLVFATQDDLFNPNVHDPRRPSPLPPLPLVCLGPFRPSQRVADWLPATYYLLAYARITVAHGLNPEAQVWARSAMASGRFPADRRPFSDGGER